MAQSIGDEDYDFNGFSGMRIMALEGTSILNYILRRTQIVGLFLYSLFCYLLFAFPGWCSWALIFGVC
jgi:hypothetical protein